MSQTLEFITHYLHITIEETKCNFRVFRQRVQKVQSKLYEYAGAIEVKLPDYLGELNIAEEGSTFRDIRDNSELLFSKPFLDEAYNGTDNNYNDWHYLLYLYHAFDTIDVFIGDHSEPLYVKKIDIRSGDVGECLVHIEGNHLGFNNEYNAETKTCKLPIQVRYHNTMIPKITTKTIEFITDTCREFIYIPTFLPNSRVSEEAMRRYHQEEELPFNLFMTLGPSEETLIWLFKTYPVYKGAVSMSIGSDRSGRKLLERTDGKLFYKHCRLTKRMIKYLGSKINIRMMVKFGHIPRGKKFKYSILKYFPCLI
jgi:hypothetical protein